MILADKIIQLRKKQGWSQEELAERLNVSRQAVSKWEGAQSVPDLNKLLAMADLFGVSTDYLLREDLGEGEIPPAPVREESGTEAWYRVSLSEAVDYLAATEQAAGKIAAGVALCILSPILSILLSVAGETGLAPFTEDQGGILGTVVLILMIAGAVALFVWSGGKNRPFQALSKLPLETEYGVTGMVKERRKEYEPRHTRSMVLGVALCVLSVAPVLVCALLYEEDDFRMAVGTSLLLVLVAAGVFLIVGASVRWAGFQTLLEEGDYSREEKSLGDGMGIYWCVITAAYLALSFLTGRWDMTWIIWPVAGVLCPLVKYLLRRGAGKP